MENLFTNTAVVYRYNEVAFADQAAYLVNIASMKTPRHIIIIEAKKPHGVEAEFKTYE
jgi:hypothetical protein